MIFKSKRGINRAMDDTLLARSIRAESNLLCDWRAEGHNPIIRKGKHATQVVGEGVKAQGLYHSRACYEAALQHYEELERGEQNKSDQQ